MTDPPHQDPRMHPDRTRDIALPPLPGRPASPLPKEWQALHGSVDSPTTAVPGPAAPPAGAASTPPGAASTPPGAASTPSEASPAGTASPAEPSPGISREEAVARIEARRLASQPTDEMQHPPLGRGHDRTLAFSSPEMRRRPVEPVAVGRTARRWPWVVLTLLPILVIVGAGVAWLILLRGA